MSEIFVNDEDIDSVDISDLEDEVQGEHVSATERFEDFGFEVVSWDADMAMRLVGVDRSWPRDRQVQALQDAVNDERLPDQAVERLIDYGFTELA